MAAARLTATTLRRQSHIDRDIVLPDSRAEEAGQGGVAMPRLTSPGDSYTFSALIGRLPVTAGGVPPDSQGWGAKVIDRLAADLKAAFPDSRGFSRSNLEYMRRLAASHPDPGFPQQPAGELPWGHWMVLLDKLSADPDLQRWYAAQAVEHGWSRAVLQ